MHLEREFFRRGENLEQQRELIVGEVGAGDLVAMLGEGLFEREAGPWAGLDDGLRAGEPGFADGLGEVGIGIPLVPIGAAPGTGREERGETEWRRAGDD
jgi:hypothetical protein